MNKGLEVKNNAAEFDALGIGSALLDFIVEVKDEVLLDLGLKKGEMQLIDETRSRDLLDRLKGYTLQTAPGGSAANTIAGLAGLGGKGSFIGKVGDDSLGEMYVGATKDTGVEPLIGRVKSLTGHAITFITPDSERSFATHLGAALELSERDVDESVIGRAKIVHLEGYLFEPANLRAVCMKVLRAAKEKGVLVSIDLSDPGLVTRIPGVFREVTRDYADILFANEDEAKAFTGLEREKALGAMAEICGFAVVKLGSEGSLIQTGGRVHRIPVCRTSVVNTNGAGDMYAAGVLYGIARGYDPARSGNLASYASSLVVAQAGARMPGRIDPERIGR